jgi:heat shock protein HtpX
MKMAKRVFLFMAVNLLIVITISTVLSLLGISPYLNAYGLDPISLGIFCLVWGFGGAFISLALSRVMAKAMMGVKIIDKKTSDPALRDLMQRVHQIAKRAGLKVMPEVGYYESPELNAFATGPTRDRALVAVSTGLLEKMSDGEVDGVLAHEVAHINNGDMVTMTLLQGLVNAFVMFFARIIAFAISQTVKEEQRRSIQFMVVLVAEIVLGILGMIVVSAFSRAREYRADAGGAKFAGRAQMIAALQKLKLNYDSRIQQRVEDQPALATLKISGKGSGFINLFATHPPLEERIARLQSGV